MKRIGQGVYELWSDIKTDKQRLLLYVYRWYTFLSLSTEEFPCLFLDLEDCFMVLFLDLDNSVFLLFIDLEGWAFLDPKVLNMELFLEGSCLLIVDSRIFWSVRRWLRLIFCPLCTVIECEFSLFPISLGALSLYTVLDIRLEPWSLSRIEVGTRSFLRVVYGADSFSGLYKGPVSPNLLLELNELRTLVLISRIIWPIWRMMEYGKFRTFSPARRIFIPAREYILPAVCTPSTITFWNTNSDKKH